jgi:hypothetical protein
VSNGPKRLQLRGLVVRFALGLTFCAALALASPAVAQDAGSIPTRPALGPGAGTLVSGGETGLRLSDRFGLRFGAHLGPEEAAGTRAEADTKIDLTPAAGGAVLDYYPFEGGFRLSGGLRIHVEGPDAASAPGDITIGGLPFTPSQGAMFGDGAISVGYVPYGGLGLESSFWDGRLELAFDLGVYYQAEGRADPQGDGTSGGAAAGSDPKSDEAELEDDLSFLGFHPIVGLTAKYRF